MNKSLFILVSLLFAGMCLIVSPATAADITLSYANFPPAPTFPCVQMEHWAAEVEKRTQGAVDVQTYPGSTLLGAKNMWDGVIQGQADIGCISLSYQPGVFPMLSVLEQPFGFSSATVASLALYDLWERYHPEEFKRVKVLTMFTSAPSNIMSKVAVRELSDLKGLEIRASGGASTVMKLLGATPVSMPASETPEALQKGLVKGVFSSFDWLKDFNFAEYLPYATVTNLQVYPFAVIMNKQSWEQLPSEVKQVLDGLRREQSLWTGRYLDGHIEESLAWSKETYDLEVITLPEEQLAAANRQLSVMVEDWKAKARAASIDADAVVADLLASKTLLEERYGR